MGDQRPRRIPGLQVSTDRLYSGEVQLMSTMG